MSVGLTVPARLLARLAEPAAHAPVPAPHMVQTFETAVGSQTAPSLSAVVDVLTPYERRVVDVARTQMSKMSGMVAQRDIVAVADFARPSHLPRLHFVNLETGRLDTQLVAHGRGSDHQHDGWLKSFSNTINSEATSRGAYATCAIYDGKYGPSIRLRGLESDNSNAFERAIVMHPAWYAKPDMLSKYGKLGRSEGCFAMDPDQFGEALHRLAGGRLLFADRIGDA